MAPYSLYSALLWTRALMGYIGNRMLFDQSPVDYIGNDQSPVGYIGNDQSPLAPYSLYIVHYFKPEPYGTLFPIYSALL